MFVRGVNSPEEYKRNDTAFYKGIVVKNNDPSGLYRVKVYIPEISNQPLQEWLTEYKKFNMRFPGKNNKNDNWVDTKIYEEIAKFIPWADPCMPLFGEGGPGRYNANGEICTISDTDYYDGFETNNDRPPALAVDTPPLLPIKSGSFAPAWLYECFNTSVGDAFSNPQRLLSGNGNPYSYLTRPSKHVNKSKGVFGVPSVGTKVWVFHYAGDTNFPVYFGVHHDYRETSLMLDHDQPECRKQSLTQPGNFENVKI